MYAHRDGSECCPSHRTQRVWSARGRGSRGNGLYYPRAPPLTILTISCLKSKDQRGRGVRRPAGRQYRPLPWCPPAQEIKHTAGGMVENGLYCRRLPTTAYRLHSSVSVNQWDGTVSHRTAPAPAPRRLIAALEQPARPGSGWAPGSPNLSTWPGVGKLWSHLPKEYKLSSNSDTEELAS